jgi:hypothetical protein
MPKKLENFGKHSTFHFFNMSEKKNELFRVPNSNGIPVMLVDSSGSTQRNNVWERMKDLIVARFPRVRVLFWNSKNKKMHVACEDACRGLQLKVLN